MKMGSLFSGSGTCEWASVLCDVEPVWASEVEPFPIAVTTKRFPNMKHLGDITQINGAEIEPVDIITFGSPCQDMSIAGTGAGLTMQCPECGADRWDNALVLCPLCGHALEPTRSALILEAFRIFKEMRVATNGRYPRFVMWENVLGAFSSNKGEDFRFVLEKLCQIKEPLRTVSRPKKWGKAGAIVADEYSVAWRVLDARFWGVPQRRRRIFLVTDFDSQRAPQILFERQGLRRDFTQGRAPGQGAAAAVEIGVDSTDGAIGFNGYNQCVTGDVAKTLRAGRADSDARPVVFQAVGFMAGQGSAAHGLGLEREVSPTLKADAGGNTVPSVLVLRQREGCAGDGKGPLIGGISFTLGTTNDQVLCTATQPVYGMDSDRNTMRECIGPLTAAAGTSGNNQPVVYCHRTDNTTANGLGVCENTAYTLDGSAGQAVVFEEHGQDARYTGPLDVAPTVAAKYGTGGGNAPIVIDCRNGKVSDECPTLQRGGKGLSLNCIHPVIQDYIARRLMPIECGRLQGMPDWWCEDIPHSDSAEYKMWGNGMALPCVLYVMEGLAEETAMRILDERLSGHEHTSKNGEKQRRSMG